MYMYINMDIDMEMKMNKDMDMEIREVDCGFLPFLEFKWKSSGEVFYPIKKYGKWPPLIFSPVTLCAEHLTFRVIHYTCNSPKIFFRNVDLLDIKRCRVLSKTKTYKLSLVKNVPIKIYNETKCY